MDNMDREFGWDDVIENDGKDWVLLPDNMGERLSIDESSLQDDLFTFLTSGSAMGAPRSSRLVTRRT